MSQTSRQGTPAGSSAPPAQTPATGYSQWPAASIPIDPALQASTSNPAGVAAASPYQHYQPYSYYGGHYQYQTAAPTTPQPMQPIRTAPTPATSSAPAAQSGSGGMDTSDVATLNDALGSAGVDLRAEEESLQRSSDHHAAYRSYNNEDRSRKQLPKPSFDTMYLGTTMRIIGNQHKVTRVPEESVNNLALALRARLQDLITGMIAAAHHRTDTQFDRPASLYDDGQPMWSILVRNDVAKQLAALEKVEREETLIRREQKERADMAAAHAAALAAQAAATNPPPDMDDGEGGTGKKRKKKEGPGVTARNMSEDVRKKMSNAVASQVAGLGGKYSWMNAANANAAPSKAKAATANTSASVASPTPPATTTAPATTGGWARPYVPVTAPATPVEDDNRTPITMRDAMFVIEKERGHGGGRGAAKGWM